MIVFTAQSFAPECSSRLVWLSTNSCRQVVSEMILIDNVGSHGRVDFGVHNKAIVADNRRLHKFAPSVRPGWGFERNGDVTAQFEDLRRLEQPRNKPSPRVFESH
jgi:hypothetical protein